jgi:ArsR family transcriptional regulator, arsenate/arsenite/antimonite-responsive transcriptional repressor
MSSKPMSADERAKIFKALADPRRVEIVDQLAGGSLCGTQLAEALGISTALLCHHWDVLVEAGILRKERQGQLRICTLDLERIREATGGWIPTPTPPATPQAPPPATTAKKPAATRRTSKRT